MMLRQLQSSYKLTPKLSIYIEVIDDIDTRAFYYRRKYEILRKNGNEYVPGGLYSCFYFKYGLYYLTRYLLFHSPIILPMFTNKLLKYIKTNDISVMPNIVFDIFVLFIQKENNVNSRTRTIMDCIWMKYKYLYHFDLVSDVRNTILEIIINW